MASATNQAFTASWLVQRLSICGPVGPLNNGWGLNMRSFLHILIISFALLFFAGCSSSKIIAKQELIGAQQKNSDILAKLSVGVLPVEDTPVDYQLERFVNDLNQANVFQRVEVATRADKWPDILRKL